MLHKKLKTILAILLVCLICLCAISVGFLVLDFYNTYALKMQITYIERWIILVVKLVSIIGLTALPCFLFRTEFGNT